MVILVSAGTRKRDRRRKSKLKRWSRQRRFPLIRKEFTILPTRKTLTYAEAQKFVDVLSDGQIHRLNISDAIDVESSREVIEAIEAEQPDDHPKADDLEINKSVSATPSQVCDAQTHVPDSSQKRAASFKLTPAYLRCFETTPEELDAEIEYDVDEEDIAWLKLLNDNRKANKLVPVALDSLEFVLDRLEKEAHSLTTSCPAPTADGAAAEKQAACNTSEIAEIKVCSVCRESWACATNGILVCDSCGLSVHQDCYGVPYFPEGQWLCKKCLKSPNSPVKCCLCPCSCKGKTGPGAMKQTNDGRWVHILCALFIPEVSFGSNVYLEPVERVEKVPRWRSELKCRGCNKVGRGACLGCQAPGCPHSYHALCAVNKGCYLKLVASSSTLSDVDSSKTLSSKRTGDRRTRIFYCPKHFHLSIAGSDPNVTEAPKNNDDSLANEDDSSRLLKKDETFCSDQELSLNNSPGKQPRKKPGRKPKKGDHSMTSPGSCIEKGTPRADGRLMHLAWPVAIPNLSQQSLTNISNHLTVRDRQQLMMRIHRYWLLKRHSRRGLPLIQRLQQVLFIHNIRKFQSTFSSSPSLDENGLKCLKKLRQDYEKVRLLLELIRKREKLKVELLKLREAAMELQLQPFCMLLRHTLDQLQFKDAVGLFAYPVTEEEAPGYHGVIERPMDYSTMRSKVDEHVYKSIDEFEDDFNLIIDNCIKFNGTESPLYKIAIKHKKQCSIILESARRMCDRADYCLDTGIHNDNNNNNDETVVMETSTVTPGVILSCRSALTASAFISGKAGRAGDVIPSEKSEGVEVPGEDEMTDEVAALKSRLEQLHKRLDVLHVVRTNRVFYEVKQVRKDIAITKRRLTVLMHQRTNQTSLLSSGSTPINVADVESCEKPNHRTSTPKFPLKRNVYRSLAGAFAAGAPSTIPVDKSAEIEDESSPLKRPCTSEAAEAASLLSSSSLSSTTIVHSGFPLVPPVKKLPGRPRGTTRRHALHGKVTGGTLYSLRRLSSQRKNGIESPGETVASSDILGFSEAFSPILLARTVIKDQTLLCSPKVDSLLGGSSPMADENREPVVVKEDQAAALKQFGNGLCQMNLRSSSPNRLLEEAVRSVETGRRKNLRKPLPMNRQLAGLIPSKENHQEVTAADQKDSQPLFSAQNVPKRIIKGCRKIYSKVKVREPPTSVKRCDGAAADGVGEKNVTRRQTRSASTRQVLVLEKPVSISSAASSIADDNKLIKSAFIEKAADMSLKSEKMLLCSPVVLVKKAVASKTSPNKSEEHDSSYESSYSLDSNEAASSSGVKLSAEVESLPSRQTLNDSSLLLDARESVSSLVSQPGLDCTEISFDIENKAASKSEKTSRSSSICSKDAEDLLTPLQQGDIVWAKTKGYPWYPALVITTDSFSPTNDTAEFFQNLVPPEAVVSLRSKFVQPVFLIRFFDKRRNWQWLPRNKLDLLRGDFKLDKEKINSVKQSNFRKDIKRAYDAATHHLRKSTSAGLRQDGTAEKKRGRSPPDDGSSRDAGQDVDPKSKTNRNQEGGDGVSDRPEGDLPDFLPDAPPNCVSYETTSEGKLSGPVLLAEDSVLPAQQQQLLLNCSQQFLTSSFQLEKQHMAPNNIQLTLSQQPEMLSCSL